MLQNGLIFLEEETRWIHRVLEGVSGEEAAKPVAHIEIDRSAEILGFYLAQVYDDGFEFERGLYSIHPYHEVSSRQETLYNRYNLSLMYLRSIPGAVQNGIFLPKYALFSIN